MPINFKKIDSEHSWSQNSYIMIFDWSATASEEMVEEYQVATLDMVVWVTNL